MSSIAIQPDLLRCPGLESLGSELLAEIAGFSRVIEAAANVLLCRQGDPPYLLRYLLEGQAVLTQASTRSGSAVIDIVRPVSSLELGSVVADQPHAVAVQTLRRSRLLEIDATALRRMMGVRPSLAVVLLHGVSLDVQSTARQVVDLKAGSTATRLAAFLLSLAGDGPAKGESAFQLPYSKRLLAAQIGCRQENLSRAFAVLRDFGVESHGSRVVLHDRERLQSLVGNGRRKPGLTGQAEAFSSAFEL